VAATTQGAVRARGARCGERDAMRNAFQRVRHAAPVCRRVAA
jgi:hypothetical protein